MQWSDDDNAGFSDPGAETWLPVNDNYVTLNVEEQLEDPFSHLAVYRAAAQIKRGSTVIQVRMKEREKEKEKEREGRGRELRRCHCGSYP